MAIADIICSSVAVHRPRKGPFKTSIALLNLNVPEHIRYREARGIIALCLPVILTVLTENLLRTDG